MSRQRTALIAIGGNSLRDRPVHLGGGRLLVVWGMSAVMIWSTVLLRAQTPSPVVNAELADVLETAVGDVGSSTLADLPAIARAQLRATYAGGGWALLWVDGSGRPHADTHEALQLLDSAVDDGLDPRDYRAAVLKEQALALDQASNPAAADVVAFDVGLSAGMVLYLRDLHVGRVDPRSIGFRMTIGADDHDFPSILHSALLAHRITEIAADMTPQSAFYRDLRAVLTRYRGLAAGPSLYLPTPAGRAVRPGETYAGLTGLRRRLVALGDWPDEASPAVDSTMYEGPLVEAVKRFQIRHGLDADGVIGPQTLEALRVPLTWRLRQIELSLERLRWLPHPVAGRLLIVNIPMFRLWAWNSMMPGDMPAFASNVIVGRALDTETSVFVDEMSHIIFRPYWNVPSGILRSEILPELERDADYLRRQNMEIVDGPGDAARPVDVTADSVADLRQGRFRVRQRPGPANALGLVKFVFPNDESLYLHATPATDLFARSRRDFSHGCVRVEDPSALAEWALAGQDGWTSDRMLAAMDGPQPTRVDLKQPIPVILFYITAVVMPEDGLVHFASDIYGHDTTLDGALQRLGRHR